jgi:hypothetical protein
LAVVILSGFVCHDSLPWMITAHIAEQIYAPFVHFSCKNNSLGGLRADLGAEMFQRAANALDALATADF